MSTPPPPPLYGQVPETPSGFDRRAIKAQRRFAAAQMKQQRAQSRAASRAARRGSAVGPLLLVGIGLILLLLQTGHLRWSQVFSWLGHWWPVVLILAGVLMLAEWAWDGRQLAQSGTVLPSRRFLGGGTVTLLLLLGIVGAGMMAAQNSSFWMRRHLDERFWDSGMSDWPKVLGVSSDYEDELHASLLPNGTLTVEDPRGDVTITGSSTDGQAHVAVHQHVSAWHSVSADERRRAEKAQLTGDTAHLVLTAPSLEGDDADVSIELPHDAAVIIHSLHGDVTLEELRGGVDVSAQGGDVNLTAIRGPVHLQLRDDDSSVTAHSLANGLTLEGRAGDIALSDIDGAVSLHGDFFGTTHLEHIHGSVHFQSSFTDFACAGIPGDMDVEGRSDLDAHKLLGPVTITTTNRNMDLEQVRGAATVSDRNGSIKLGFTGPLEPVHISNENGSVDLSVPSGASFSIQAQTQNGTIENDFGLNAQTSGEAAQLRSQLGRGGPALSLTTNEGDVGLHRSSSNDSVDWNDTPQRITSAPSGRPSPKHTPSAP